MADGKLIFPVKFDLQSAVKEAQGDVDAVLRRLETQINSRPLKIKIDGGFTNMGVIGSIKKSMEAALNAQQMMAKDGSIKAMRTEMSALITEWEKLNEKERTATDANGKFAGRAGEIVKRFAELTAAANTHARSLNQLVSAADKATAAEEKAAKKRAETATRLAALKNPNMDSLAEVKASLKYYEQLAGSARQFSAGWEICIQRIKELKTRSQELSDIYKTMTRQSVYNMPEGNLNEVRDKIKALKTQMEQATPNSTAWNDFANQMSRLREVEKGMVAEQKEAIKTESELRAEKTKAANEELANQRKIKAERTRNVSDVERERAMRQQLIAQKRQELAVLNGEERSLDQVNAKLAIRKRLLESSRQGTSFYDNNWKEVQRLEGKQRDMTSRLPEAQRKEQEALNKALIEEAAKRAEIYNRKRQQEAEDLAAQQRKAAEEARIKAESQARAQQENEARKRILNEQRLSYDTLIQKIQMLETARNKTDIGAARWQRLTNEINKAKESLKVITDEMDKAAKRSERLARLREIMAMSTQSMQGLSARMQEYNAQLQKLEYGSQAFDRLAAHIAKLNGEYQKASQYAQDFQNKAFQGLWRSDMEAQVGKLRQLREELALIDRRINALYQHQNMAGNTTNQSMINQLLDQRMAKEREIANLTKTAAQQQAEREREINKIIESRRAKQKAHSDAVRQTVQARKQERTMLMASEKTVDNITKKLQHWQTKLNSTNLGSAEFTKIAKEVERLTRKLDQYKQKIAEATGQSTSGASRQAANARKVNEEYSKQLGYIDRLIRRMAVYGSVGMIGQFLTKVREVTAQFELQRISLGAILQDQNKANQLFSEIKSFALKSPVSILDLTKYTKQLAAYRIGYDELFETTKKLTDVSVGLGVSMDRVVLAYGQVRATGHLRASEIRQFTEMGVPIVEELAAKLSKLNGETVTAAQVMDMVSKRAISFEMVKDVFDDMTSAGGIFYNMQEKQGNTLYGLWAKLGDAASVMYSEIGNTEAVNDGMKSLISSMTWLMKNWKGVGRELGIVVAGFGAYKLVQKLTTISTIAQSKATRDLARAEAQLTLAKNAGNKAQIKANNYLRIAAMQDLMATQSTNMLTSAKYRLLAVQNRLKAALAGNWLTLLLTALAAVGTAIYSAVEKANRLKNALKDIQAETISLQNQSVGRFEHLAEEAVNAADGSKKQRDALAELSRTYGDILPQDALKLENLKKLNHQYGELTTTLKEYIAIQQKNKAMEEVNSTYGDQINSASKQMIDSLEDYMKIDRDTAIRIVGEFQREMSDQLEKGEKDARSLSQRLIDNARKFGVEMSKQNASYLLTDSDMGHWYTLGIGANSVQQLSDALVGLHDKQEEVNKQYDASTGVMGAWTKEMENAKKKVDELALTNPDGSPIDSSTFQGSQIKANETMKVVADLINNDTQIKNAIANKEVEWNQDWIHLVGSVDKDNLMDITTVNFDAIIEALNVKHPELADKIREIQKEWGGIAPTNATVVQIKYKMGQIADAFKVSMDKMQKYLWDGSGSVDDYLKRLKDQQAELRARLKEKQQDLLNMGVLSKWWNKLLGNDIEAEVKQMEKEVKALDTLIPFVTGYTVPEKSENKRSKGSKSDTRLQELQEINQTLEKINKEYDDLSKKEGKSKALADIKKQFNDTLNYTNKLGKKFGLHFDYPTEFKSLQQYRREILEVMKSLKNLKGGEKTILEFETMIGKADSDYLQKQIESELKRLADRISRTKTAKEFYEKILRLTRNEDLAFRATFSVFGQDKLDTFNDEVEQLKQNFGEIDITAAINLNTKQIGYKKLRNIWDADKSLPDNLRKIPQAYDSAINSILDAGDKLSERQLERWGKDLERAREYADKRIELAQYTTTQIAEIEAKRDSLDPESKNYAAQVAMYNKMISGYREREKNEAAKLDYEQIKEQIGMFDDLGVRIGTAFESILTQLREYTQSPDFARLGLEAQKNVYQQIAKIEDRMAEGFQGIGVGTVSEYVRQYSTAASEYLTAQNNLRDATLRAIEADKEWERVKESNDEAAKTAAWAEKQLADSRVRTAAASVNTAGANLQATQERAARASAEFDSNLQKVEQSIRGLNNGALKALWDLLGDKGKRSVGEFLSGSYKMVSAINKLTEAVTKSGSDMGALSKTIAGNLANALQGIDPEDTEAIAKAATESLKTTLSSVISDKGVVELLSNTLSKNIGEIASQALSGVLSTEDAANKVGALIDGIADAASKTGEMWGAIISLVLSLLDEFAENGIGTFLSELLDNIADAVEGILANLLTDSLPKILGSVGNVVKGVGVGLADMLTFGAFDLTGVKRIKRANKEIKSQQELLDQLEYTYGRLEKAADKAFGRDYLNNYNQQLKNLQAQQQAYLKQAEAERSKGKKEDEEKTKQYLEEARDIRDQIAEMEGSISEKMFGSDLASTARDFAQAWLDAYKEFGNTADAMSEKFHEMIQNMIVESLLGKVMERALEPAFDMIDNMSDSDFYSESFWKDLMQTAEEGAQNADHGAGVVMDWVEKMGFSVRDMGGEFSGIAKDIAGATSEEINSVAAIGNTLMYYVSPIPRIDENVARIVAIMQGGGTVGIASGAVYTPSDYTGLLTTANEHLSSLPRMEQHLAEIHTMLGRIIVTRGAYAGINTYMKS